MGASILLGAVGKGPAANLDEVVVQGVAFLFAVGAGIAVWAWLIARWRRGIPLVTYTRRRPVPWGGPHALLILLGHRAALELVPLLLVFLLGIPAERGGAAGPPAALQNEHPVGQLMRERPGVGTLLLCVLAVFLAAPIVEEFVFRVVFQGWLESEDARGARDATAGRRRSRGVVPIGLVSLVFAALHYRSAAPALRADFLLAAIGGSAIANLLVLAIAVWVLRRACGATWRDLGLVPRRLARDVLTGVIAFLAGAPIVYLFQAAAMLLLPDWIAPDPIGLFVFSVGLGYLYFRTHRAAPSIAMHMALNGTTLLLLLLIR